LRAIMAEATLRQKDIAAAAIAKTAAQIKVNRLTKEERDLGAEVDLAAAEALKWIEAVKKQKTHIAVLTGEGAGEVALGAAKVKLVAEELKALKSAELAEGLREDRKAALVNLEAANLELTLAISAEKKAIVIAKATENAAAVQGKAWCIAK